MITKKIFTVLKKYKKYYLDISALPKKHNDKLKKLEIEMKLINITSVFAIALLLSGCTALLWEENKPTEHDVKYRTEIKDNVFSVMKYENLQLLATQDGKISQLGIPQQGVAFLGEKNIYILSKGADELLALNDNINKLPLAGKHDGNKIRLKLSTPDKSNPVIRFSDTFRVNVSGKENDLTTEQLTILKELGFYLGAENYRKDISIAGVIISRNSFTYPLNISNKLTKLYPVEFYSTQRITRLNLLNIAENVVITPVALAADIVFFPVTLMVLQLVAQ